MRPISMYFCLFYAAVAESYEINIEGFEGEQTSFLCSHKLASSRKKYFCKDPCNTDKDILATVVPNGSTVKGRLSLKDFGDGAFRVTFNPLQLSDTHLYYCAVERFGFVTYTSVDIRVQKALTTPAAHVLSTFPSQPFSSSAPLLTNSTMQPTNSSTATNPPENEEKVNWGTVLYATLGTFAVLALLILVAGCRKLKDISKPQLNICSTNRDASEQEIQSEMDSEKMEKSIKTVFQSNFVSGQCQMSGSQELRVYENLPNVIDTAGFRLAGHQKSHKNTSEIYINVLP